MAALKTFIVNLFSKYTTESSKRVFGALGFVCAIVFIAIWRHDIIEELLYTSAALLGLGVLDRLNKEKKL